MTRFRLAVFDLDGTILREKTACEILAQRLGRTAEMQVLESYTEYHEIAQGRIDMNNWYSSYSMEELTTCLDQAILAPGAKDAFRLLNQQGVNCGIATMTWEFIARYFAAQLGVNHIMGVTVDSTGKIQDVWPEDKKTWIRDLQTEFQISREETLGIGDSANDVFMLAECGTSVFVGQTLPVAFQPSLHAPNANLFQIVSSIL